MLLASRGPTGGRCGSTQRHTRPQHCKQRECGRMSMVKLLRYARWVSVLGLVAVPGVQLLTPHPQASTYEDGCCLCCCSASCSRPAATRLPTGAALLLPLAQRP